FPYFTISFKHSTDIPICYNAKQLIIIPYNGCGSKPSLRYSNNDRLYSIVKFYKRPFILFVKVFHTQVSLFTQGSAGVQFAKLLASKTFHVHQCYGNGVAHGKLSGGGGSGGQVIGTSFLRYGGIQKNIAVGCQVRIPVPRHSDYGITKGFYKGY